MYRPSVGFGGCYMKNTKNEIVRVAKEMFMLEGYDNTSVRSIIDKVGIAKGTLYHHFSSKKEIMDYVLNETLEAMVLKARAIASSQNHDVITRIVMLFTKLSLEEEEYLLDYIHKPENIKLNYYQNKLMIEHMKPILGDLIKEGKEQKIFDVKFPYGVAELIIIYITELFDYNANLSKEEEAKKIEIFFTNLERLLGVKEGTFKKVVNGSGTMDC